MDDLNPFPILADLILNLNVLLILAIVLAVGLVGFALVQLLQI